MPLETAFILFQRFLWPFQLEPLRTKYQRDKLNLKEEGEYGDRGELMDDWIRQNSIGSIHELKN